jgi:ATP-dependent DNA ligase
MKSAPPKERTRSGSGSQKQAPKRKSGRRDIPGSANPAFDLPLDTSPMEARSADELPGGPGWRFEPKWDGFRCLAFRSGERVDLRAKSGKSLGRYFPEVVSLLQNLRTTRFVVDGELVIEIDGRLSFGALQMRLHPAASRIRKLADETPARLILFDMLVSGDGERLVEFPLEKRRAALEAFAKTNEVPDRLIVSAYTQDRKRATNWLRDFGEGATDGVIAKRSNGPYQSGERVMVKVKRLRTADCVVGGFRYESKSREIGSLLLGLYDQEGKLNHVGYTSNISNEERPALTRRVESLRKPPGFTGRSPGGPSRWSTERSGEWEPLEPKLVAEVRFDHVSADRFRHGTKFIRWRLDKDPRQCTFEQIAPPIANVS